MSSDILFSKEGIVHNMAFYLILIFIIFHIFAIIIFFYRLIKRIKDTKPQYNLKRAQRTENLKDAFKVDPSKLQKGKLLIIDDICTTGSTFEEMIRELKKHNINDIVCLAATTPFGE